MHESVYDRRQFELVRSLCLAAMRAPETNFSLARELIAIGEIADAAIVAADAAAHEAQIIAEADRIKTARTMAAESA